ncbi:ABC-type sugar transport system, permease component [Desulfomonile tiedjei DSM 6799]|uniref:ABC-type sugar transport system, permease component n=2 Tax=Desulfomonile tiedjei TaxID=2358 RepID=I4C348_DESTA|nr:ABC-type sugar transport system, permease component [Desulfomonile tiedjei DSM 6799]
MLAISVFAIIFVSVAPFLWFGLLAFKPYIDITAVPPRIFPSHFSLEAMSSAIYKHDLFHYLKNSVIVAGTTTVLSVVIGTLAAYPLARISIKYKRTILLVILAAGMFPQIAIAGPIWRLLRDLGWLNTYHGLILPYLAFSLPITVWILAIFFSELPRELEEAAKIDGADLFQILRKIIVPLAAPGIFTAAILSFIACWNEFFFALLIMTRSDFQTLPVGIALFPGEHTMPWGEIAAASLVTTLPLVVFTLFFQKRIIAGLTSGAVKG